MLRPLQRAPTAEVEVSAEVRLWKLLVRVSTCLALKSYEPGQDCLDMESDGC